ncbi:ubiquitin-specific protease ubp2 [Ceratocystis pirilliformis]|uniref:ubiquitinyl hydrolase 1 n=1 Tax=Ceratocystis pirilliformis TaxID=259994 RepID=A0ABR3YWP3_9PEZI
MSLNLDGLPGQVQETTNGDLPLPYARSAPLLIHDLLDQNLGPEWPEFMNLDTDNTIWAKTYGSHDLSEHLVAPGGRKRLQTKHTLLQSGVQNGQLDGETFFNSSCCLHCCHHFLVRITKPSGEQSPCKCPGKTLSEGFHHLTFWSTYTNEEIREITTERRRLVTGARYRCTADNCGVVVEIEISQPRISAEWIQKLTDKDRIMTNLRNAITEDPGRFADAQESWVDAGLAQLFTYAKDLITKPEVKRLTKRNKRFVVVMGPEMYDLFRSIGYTDIIEEKDGVTEECFMPKVPEPQGPVTLPGTYRAYMEDIQTELECMMRHLRMQKGDFMQLSNRLAIRNIEDIFDCDGYTFIEGRAKLSWPFRFLGAMPNFSTRLLEDTYNRQCLFDPENKDCYTDALFSIARDSTNGHGSEFDRKVKAMVRVEMDYLLATWDVPDIATDDEIISAFKKALRDNPSQVETCFELLQTFVNQGRRSSRLQKILEHRMPASLAADVLGIQPQDDANLVIKQARDRMSAIKKEIVARAILAIARERKDVQLLRESKRIQQGAPPPLWPVGLENIGNTCYLNSILQYLYTLTPIQALVKSYGVMELSENDVSDRRIGASKSKVSLLDLLVSQEFVKELNKLFLELQTVPVGPTQPTQVLANTVLLTDTQLQTVPETGSSNMIFSAANQPSVSTDIEPFDDIFMSDAPLISPTPHGTVSLSEINPIAGGSLTPPPEIKPVDLISNVSSETLMGDDDTPMTMVPSIQPSEHIAKANVEETEVLPSKVPTAQITKNTLDRGAVQQSLQSKHEFSMQQQDVEEIFGRIIDRIQAGISSTGFVYDGIQNDFVMQTFFFRMVTYTIKKNATGQELPAKREAPEFYRYITAFPAQSDACTLYEALDRTFDRDEIEGVESISRYTAILDDPPPVLHILVQRTQDNGQKNYNPVIIDDFLDLDRYMDAPEDSDLMKRRKKGWALRKRLRSLDAVAYGNIREPSPSSLPSLVLRDEGISDMGDSVDSALVGDKEQLCRYACEQDGLPKTVFSSAQKDHEAFAIPEPAGGLADGDGRMYGRAEAEAVYKLFESEKAALNSQCQTLFDDMKKLRYRLHAVFCHSGRQSGGHYWVWIHDFKAGVWRKYNDTWIEERAEILPELNKGSDPYYLCYVLDKDVDFFVDVPQRKPRDEDDVNEGLDFNMLDNEA